LLLLQISAQREQQASGFKDGQVRPHMKGRRSRVGKIKISCKSLMCRLGVYEALLGLTGLGGLTKKGFLCFFEMASLQEKIT
jgi:hypothetical protein